MVSVIWTALETAPFTNRWTAQGTTLYDGVISDSETFDNPNDCWARCDVLNSEEEKRAKQLRQQKRLAAKR